MTPGPKTGDRFVTRTTFGCIQQRTVTFAQSQVEMMPTLPAKPVTALLISPGNAW